MWFYSNLATLNPLLAYLLIFTFFVGSSLVIAFATHHFTNYQTRRSHNDIAGFIFTTVGTIYAVLLAFITVIAWEQYNAASENAAKEATTALAMYPNLSVYPDQEQAGKVAQDLLAYIHAVTEDEFPKMAKMERSQTTAQAIDLLWANTIRLKPENFQEQTLFSEIVKDMNNIAQLRAERLGSAFEPKLIGIMRHMLVFGAIITLALAIFFGAESFWWHTTMTTLLAILIASILFVILELAHPFTSGLAIQPGGYVHLLKIIANK
ncbi:MAG: hypothetical protein ACLP7A_14195 [Desulfobaccales bacterium]